MKKYFALCIFALLIILAACQAVTPVTSPTAEPAPTQAGPLTLTVMTHDSFAVSKEVIETFEQNNQIKVSFIKGGDVGKALNTLILSSKAGTPPADVFYGVDNTFLSQALENKIFESYAAPALKDIDSSFILDPQNEALPIDYGDVCINYDKAYFKEHNLPVPAALEQLVDPIYKNMLVVENPATSSPGLSFLLATIAKMGSENAMTWWSAMKENGLVVVNDWETAYYTNFSASSGKGAQPMVVSYASSPAAEYIYADPKVDEAPTASITENGSCWRQIEFAGILKGTKNRAAAEKFIDFMLSLPFQEDMPMQMFVYPVVAGAKLPAEFTKASQVPAAPSSLAPEIIAKNRTNYIDAWMKLMSK
ncbi:MAG: thiamine ABC transporter substrate-binding protein [Anaerolineaceae bacterium]|nr:thiamine ABC transporter substrate-binding protein [Anaerolineaceae bacterium]